ncbi:MAG: HAD family hydrolase [Alphaproteobacteria bacterium]|nr:HAD family hydrolase [Alphaproteobacteria bacterium]
MSKNLVSLLSTGIIIADCDGTIAPKVEAAHGLCMANVVKDLSEKAGIEYSQSFFDSVWQAELGKGILNFTKQYVEGLDEESASFFMAQIGDLEKAEGLYEEAYIDFSRDVANSKYFEIRKGLAQLFSEAAANKIPVAVISNANQRVLEATLEAVFKLNGTPEAVKELTVVMGKNTIEGLGFKAKPHSGAVKCAQAAIEASIGKPVSLDNSIGIGDTMNDYLSFRSANVGRILACDNFKVAAEGMDGPDDSGFLTIGTECNVIDAVTRFAGNRDAHHHSPKR